MQCGNYVNEEFLSNPEMLAEFIARNRFVAVEVSVEIEGSGTPVTTMVLKSRTWWQSQEEPKRNVKYHGDAAK